MILNKENGETKRQAETCLLIIQLSTAEKLRFVVIDRLLNGEIRGFAGVAVFTVLVRTGIGMSAFGANPRFRRGVIGNVDGLLNVGDFSRLLNACNVDGLLNVVGEYGLLNVGGMSDVVS